MSFLSGIGRRLLIAAILLAPSLPGAAAFCAEPAPLPAPLLDASADQVLARTVVPTPDRKVGEVRLLARGKAVVVQTLLSTKVLGRVIAEIRKKEEGNWPLDAAGRGDSERYLTALGATAQAVDAEQSRKGWVERHPRLLIEFIADDGAAGVLVAPWDGDEVDGALQVGRRGEVSQVLVDRAYVLRNGRLILADSFHLPVSELDKLGPLGPFRGSGPAGPAVPPGAGAVAP